MKFKNLSYSFLAASLAAITVSCDKFKVTTNEAGDKYQLHEDVAGANCKEGDIVTFDLLIKSETDSVFKDTYTEGQPIQVDVRSGGFKGSFENALFNLSKGDSATVYVKADSLFSRIQQPLPPGVTKNSELRFLVKIKEVMTAEQFSKSQENKRVNEDKIVADFASKSLKGAVKLENGIYYLSEKSGAGATPAKGDTVVVNYKGSFFDGKVFDQSNAGQPFEFPVGLGYVIRGWDEALLGMKKGGKAKFVMPSALAYGESGAGGTIPPFTPLVFEIELLDIKR